ncbi:hypothetical protein [Rufibacter soli]
MPFLFVAVVSGDFGSGIKKLWQVVLGLFFGKWLQNALAEFFILNGKGLDEEA